MSPQVSVDPKIHFLLSVPDWQPEKASPLQGFAFSLCQKVHLLAFIQKMPTDVFELTPSIAPHRLALRIAGRLPINWYGQSPRTLKSQRIPIETAFTVIFLDQTEKFADYEQWAAASPAPVTIVAEDGGHIRYSDLSLSALQMRFLEVCRLLRGRNRVTGLDQAEAAIASWTEPEDRALSYQVGGHGTIFPNARVLRTCGFNQVAEERFARHHEGESAHIEQISLTSNSVLDERQGNPPSLANRIYPRTPDINLYCPATYDLKSVISPNAGLDRTARREIETVIRVLERQSSYGFDLYSDGQIKALLGIEPNTLKSGGRPQPSPIMQVRAEEIWLGTEAVSCLAVSEIGAVIRLPNRINRTRGLVRQFAQHYRGDRPQLMKRRELFRGVQRALSDGVPDDLKTLIDRSQDGIRIIADAHVEWLDVRGIPLGLRYNISRIPVTPGNLFIQTLGSSPLILTTPEDFREVLVVSGLPEADHIAQQFNIAFDIFGEQWKDDLRIKFVRVASRKELIAAINAFEGLMMVFDGHGSHRPDQPGVLWLGEEPVDVWNLRGEIRRPPPIVILSACDTHAADRNHATVANGFLSLGCRSVLGSVFPLHASHAATFTARLLFRVSHYIPAAIKQFRRSLTWTEVVSGMLRRQLVTDILRHLQSVNLITEEGWPSLHHRIQGLVDSELSDPFHHMREALLAYGIPDTRLDQEIETAIAASGTISYLHLGRPETILINTTDNLHELVSDFESVDRSE